jgi:hypothetical protein
MRLLAEHSWSAEARRRNLRFLPTILPSSLCFGFKSHIWRSTSLGQMARRTAGTFVDSELHQANWVVLGERPAPRNRLLPSRR